MNDNQKRNQYRVVNTRDVVIYDLLRSLEWCIDVNDGDGGCRECPSCHGLDYMGHSKDCAMVAAIEMYLGIVEGEAEHE